ncbi:hypothetical protein BS50DRAFT_490093 [Corynespora cassiicola Philippines]|uniref:Uncharacterized protein n=1 Tax=Corynespora cassiicola Philippines TaxID=1448308 RepID=A0A2T2NTB2_CORCC|nr:hypothetical protein BS50DRAFT_490093 [Corynespora cassiicola Philippines]
MSPPKTPSSTPTRASEQKERKKIYDEAVKQGRIFWLPRECDLPERAVRRAHGKGAVEKGIHNHPVVIISRPSDMDHVVHFHVITSFQGKSLDEMFGKPNDFHTSRRTWYLPISPSPEHPDATSKKAKNRFPTLDLASGATLRWHSYVNVRDVYKIDWELLRPYANPDTPSITDYRFGYQSTVQMLAKTRVLTKYEPGSQLQRNLEVPQSPKSDTASVASVSTQPEKSAPAQWDFHSWKPNLYVLASRPPKAPPPSRAFCAKFLIIIAIIIRLMLRLRWTMEKNTLIGNVCVK